MKQLLKNGTIYLIGLLVFIMASSCSICKTDLNNKSLNTTVPKLFRIAYDSRNDSIFFKKVCTVLNDSLLETERILALRTLIELNYDCKKVDWNLYNSTNSLPHYNNRFSFVLEFENGKFSYKGKQINILEIKEIINERVTNESEIIQQQNFKLPFKGFVFSVSLNDKAKTINEWHLLFRGIEEVMAYLDEIRHLISIETFDKDYNKLDFERKVTIEEKLRRIIFIVFEKHPENDKNASS